MNIHEYQAKELLRHYNITTPEGVIITNKEEINKIIDNFTSDGYVVKAQIHAGGRGLGGGVKLCKTKEEAKKHAHAMYGMNLVTHQTGPKGQQVRKIYIESTSKIAKEYYLSAVLDRLSNSIIFIASTEGGMDIETVAEKTPEKLIKISINIGLGVQPFHCRSIAFGLGLSGDQIKQFIKIISSLYEAFITMDANQIEINPLVLTEEGDFIALDAKINFDDNALYRHPDIVELRDENEEDPLEVRASKADLSYVRMDGNIGCMVNGAGLAMATMDIIKLFGATPANFLDVGGSADKARVTEAFKIILSDKSVKGILVNIFGGIMRCDIIAEGIIAAAHDVGLTIPLVVRLSGTNFELGKDILSKSDLKILVANDLAEATQKIVAAV